MRKGDVALDHRLEPQIAQGTGTRRRRATIQSELAWHREEAQRRYSLDAFLYDPPAFDAVVHPAIGFLSGDASELVLDIGCGEGKETLALASHGLCTISTDLSYVQLSRARELIRRELPGGRVHFVQANAEEMPFASASFRLVYGKAIVHHLDRDVSANEIDRLLGLEGRGAIAEPLALHPLFWLARRLTPGLRTADERPMTLAELEQFSRKFRLQELRVHFLLAPCAYLLRLAPKGERAFAKAHALLSRVDNKLLRHIPALRKFAWYGVIVFRKR